MMCPNTKLMTPAKLLLAFFAVFNIQSTDALSSADPPTRKTMRKHEHMAMKTDTESVQLPPGGSILKRPEQENEDSQIVQALTEELSGKANSTKATDTWWGFFAGDPRCRAWACSIAMNMWRGNSIHCRNLRGASYQCPSSAPWTCKPTPWLGASFQPNCISEARACANDIFTAALAQSSSVGCMCPHSFPNTVYHAIWPMCGRGLLQQHPSEQEDGAEKPLHDVQEPVQKGEAEDASLDESLSDKRAC